MGRETRKVGAGVQCTQCGSSDAIEIELQLPDGTEVWFCSCHRCENRWWNRGGESMELDAVLDLARKPKA